METYCLICKKSTTNKNSSVKRTKQNRLLFASNYAVCGTKNSRFIQNQEDSRLLTTILGGKLPKSDIPIVSTILLAKTIVLFQ